MKVTLIPVYAACFVSVANALPSSDLGTTLTRRAPEDDTSDLDLDMPEKESLGLQTTNLALTGGQSRFDWAMKWATRVTGPPALGYAIYGLVEDCTEYHDDGEPVAGNKCVPNVIWTAVSTLMCVHGYGEWAMEIGRTMQQYALQRSGEMLGEQWNGFSAFGPFRRPDEAIPMPPVKEREVDDVDILKRAEESMSENMGLEVRHIGLWNGLMPGEEAKRDEREQNYPVFAFRRNDQDFHAAYMGEGEGQGSRFKVGLGPGPQTEMNTQRLKTRQFSDDDGNYNAQYFDQGGLDVFGETTGSLDEEDWLGDEDPNEDMQWLHDEIYCTLNTDGPGSDYPGLWFGVLDHKNKLSYVSGGIAAFYPGVPSIIGYMKHEGWLETKEDCTVDDQFMVTK